MRTSFLITMCAVFGLSVRAQVQYDYRSIEHTGASDTEVLGISPDGNTVVGIFVDATGIHGFRMVGTVETQLDYPGASTTWAWGVNSKGVIVGYYTDSGEFAHSFLYDPTTESFTSFDYPGAFHTYARDINDAGQIVGAYSLDSGHTTSSGFILFKNSWITVDHPGVLCTYLNGINETGDRVAGQAQDNAWSVIGFVYQNGEFTDIIDPGASITSAGDVNSSGVVVGGSNLRGGFLWQGGAFVAWPNYPGATISNVLKNNDAGQLVGYYAYPCCRGFVATPRATYAITYLYDSSRPVQGGRTLPLKMQVLDGNGTNASSAGLTVHATSVVKTADNTSSEVIDSGNANPDNNFRYDAGLSGYIFNLSTKGLSTGAYCLRFTVGGEASPTYCAPFQTK